MTLNRSVGNASSKQELSDTFFESCWYKLPEPPRRNPLVMFNMDNICDIENGPNTIMTNNGRHHHSTFFFDAQSFLTGGRSSSFGNGAFGGGVAGLGGGGHLQHLNHLHQHNGNSDTGSNASNGSNSTDMFFYDDSSDTGSNYSYGSDQENSSSSKE